MRPARPQTHSTRRVLHVLGRVLFLASLVVFFFLPGDAPSDRTPRGNHSPWPWVLWISISAGGACAIFKADQMKAREEEDA